MARLLSILFIIPAGVLRAVVLKNLWFWFVVPTCHVSPINGWVAYGLVLVVHLVLPETADSITVDPTLVDKSPAYRNALRIIQQVLTSSLFYIIGYGVHYFATR